jgi:hypothetical protein
VPLVDLAVSEKGSPMGVIPRMNPMISRAMGTTLSQNGGYSRFGGALGSRSCMVSCLSLLIQRYKAPTPDPESESSGRGLSVSVPAVKRSLRIQIHLLTPGQNDGTVGAGSSAGIAAEADVVVSMGHAAGTIAAECTRQAGRDRRTIRASPATLGVHTWDHVLPQAIRLSHVPVLSAGKARPQRDRPPSPWATQRAPRPPDR